MSKTKLIRLHGWLTAGCKYIPIVEAHVETMYDCNLEEKTGVKFPYDSSVSWERNLEDVVNKHGWVKLNAEFYGICYSKNLITKEQIEWLCKHRNIMTRQQKECLKEINDLKGK